jgi:hypothetical protein
MVKRRFGVALALAGVASAVSLSGVAFAADLGSDGGYKDDPAPAPSYYSDTSISYRYGTKFKEPGVNNGNDIEKNILNIDHFNTDKWGSNFVDIDVLFSSDADPVNGNASQGATEIYAVLRRDWSFSKITGIGVSNWLIRDYDLHMGGDFNTKNDPFSSEKKLLVLGPQIEFNVPVGFLNVAFDVSHEWNHNGIVNNPAFGNIPGQSNISFDPAFEIEAAWAFPFEVYGAALTFKGFFNYIAPKGKDGFGNQMKGEILTRPELMLDVGNFWGKKGQFEVGVGYEYWLNKFGTDHETTEGALANTPELIGRVHF